MWPKLWAFSEVRILADLFRIAQVTWENVPRTSKPNRWTSSPKQAWILFCARLTWALCDHVGLV